MKLRDDIIRRHWRLAAIEQLAEDAKAKGLEVSTNTKVGRFRADLIARKDDVVIVYEVKEPGWGKEDTEQLNQFRRYVSEKIHGRFNLVLVTPPLNRTIDV